MITLSNVDAEKLLKYATDQLDTLRSNLSKYRTTRTINEVRMLQILVKKVNRKLNDVCPGRMNNKNKLQNNGKKI